MKKIIATSLLFGAFVGFLQLKACANNMPYEPVFEAVPISESVTTTATAEPVKTSITQVSQQPAVTSVEADNLQNALDILRKKRYTIS